MTTVFDFYSGEQITPESTIQHGTSVDELARLRALRLANIMLAGDFTAEEAYPFLVLLEENS